MGAEHEACAGDGEPHVHRPVKGECRETLETLYWYLDGELTEERRLTIRHHLEDCPPCLHTFDFEAELKTVISRRCRDQVPAALRQRVAEALASEAVMSESTTLSQSTILSQGTADGAPRTPSSDPGPGAEH